MAQDDDSFGLPDLNYKPLEPKPETTSKTPEKKAETTSGRIQSPSSPSKVMSKSQSSSADTDNNKSIIVGILVPILILVGGYFGYVYLYKKPKEAAAIEAAKKAEEDKKRKAAEEAARQAKLREEEAAKQTETATTPSAPGSIETLSAATGRFYVVAASSIDGDLIMDEAKRKSEKGISTKIIPPFGKWKFYRLTISDYDTFALAQASADETKVEYNGQLWVMRY